MSDFKAKMHQISISLGASPQTDLRGLLLREGRGRAGKIGGKREGREGKERERREKREGGEGKGRLSR